jgi:ATP-dependent Lhr-like helicase
MRPSWKRRAPVLAAGRWSLFRREGACASGAPDPSAAEFAVKILLRRYGVIFRAVLLRERLPIPWRDLARAARALELRGEIRGGRFVAGFAGEQFALPEAVPFLRRIRKRAPSEPIALAAADPLSLDGLLTPGLRPAEALPRST